MARRLANSPLWLVSLTVIAVYICFIDRIAISIAIIPIADENSWTPGMQGAVMGAFFAGYLVLQIPSGYLADRYGGKWVLGLGVLMWSVFTLLTPPAAANGFALLLACRFLMGAAEAVTWPATYALYAKWLPTGQRATAVGFMNSGIAGGSVIALVATPVLIEFWSWQVAFYIYGVIGLVWFLVWAPTTRSRPETPLPKLGPEDGEVESDGRSYPQTYPQLSLRALVTNPVIWGLIVAHMAINWNLFLMLSWLPTYINKGLGMDFSKVGLLAVAPSIAGMLMTPVIGRWFDVLNRRGWDRLRLRKLMQTAAFLGLAFGMGLLGYVQSVVLAVALVAFSNGMTAFCIGGFATNHLDIAPNQSGTLLGVTNTLGSLSAGLSVFISGLLLDYTGSWLLVFQLSAAIALAAAVFYWRTASVTREFD